MAAPSSVMADTPLDLVPKGKTLYKQRSIHLMEERPVTRLKPSEIEQMQQRLIRWYGKHGRDLPWRNTRDPYRIWVSEIMLQQTQVETVIPYYERFLAAFPTVRALARAPLQKVLLIWQGLGYYARARNLHRGARLVVSRWDGHLPATSRELLEIPGIGRSTAGAIVSLAHDRPAPILDGNVKRVLCRLFAVRRDPARPEVLRRLWTLSETLTPETHVHKYTQAIMDLGATICTPVDPRCTLCALRKECRACQRNLQHRIPLRARKKSSPHYEHALGIVRHRGRVLIRRRPEQGLLGGLWGFPTYRRPPRGGLAGALRRGLESDLGLMIKSGEKTGTVRHAYSHFKITLHVFECILLRSTRTHTGQRDWKWIHPSRLEDYPLAASDRKVKERLLAHG